MKAIIFDIDWVVIKSNFKKDEIIKDVIIKHWLYEIPWVKDILTSWLNRKILLEKIYEIKKFDKEWVLKEINDKNAILESSAVRNDLVADFIEDNKDKYLFFTNTSLPKAWLDRVLNSINMKNAFKEELMFETWTKLENINYVLSEYNLKPEEVLFIDDNINHINKVKSSWVNLLHYIDYEIDIEKELNNY